MTNLEDYNYFVDQEHSWFDYPDNENTTHVVRKGIFVRDGDEFNVEQIIITLCGLYHYGEPNMGEFNAEWAEDWESTGACKECIGVVHRSEYNKWIVGDTKTEDETE